ncbi:zinc finger protein 236 [Trichuris trichiura]|uniref:Zinc finger protein 236 n=1 Tax=Trichuris trichiura TaxID=36087 RepID=A0A077Z6N5_TRITR|nr:zinc finger protein 236 [Trichuris trichiura]
MKLSVNQNERQQIIEALNIVNGAPTVPGKCMSNQSASISEMGSTENQSLVKKAASNFNGENRYRCRVCGKFPSRLPPTKEDMKSYVCEICEPKLIRGGVASGQATNQFPCLINGSRFGEFGLSSVGPPEASSSGQVVEGLNNKKEKSLVCCNCDKQFGKAYDLRRHMRTHTGEKPYACSYCDRRFALRSTLKRHCGTHIAEKSYRCRVCFKGLSCASTLRAHMRIHNNESYECPRCSHRFRKKNRFTAHLHGRPNCALKGKKRTTTLAAQSNDDEKAKNPLVDIPLLKETGRGLVPIWKGNTSRTNEADYWLRRFVCSFCQKRFLKLSHLICHIRVHTKERPYICHFCRRRFATSSTLRDHMTSHSKKRDFRCNICAKSFVLQRSLNRHMSIHSNEAPYVCPICYKRFKRREQCRLHVNVHSTELPATTLTNGEDVVSTMTNDADQSSASVDAPILTNDGQRTVVDANFVPNCYQNSIYGPVYVNGTYPMAENENECSSSQYHQAKNVSLRYGFADQPENDHFINEASLFPANFKSIDNMTLSGVQLINATELYLCYGCAMTFSHHVDLVKHLLDNDLSVEHFNLILYSIRDYSCHLCIHLSPFGLYEDYANHMELFHALRFRRQCPSCFTDFTDGFELSRHIAQEHVFRTWLFLANGEETTPNMDEVAASGFLTSSTSCLVDENSEEQSEMIDDSISAILAAIQSSNEPAMLPAIPNVSLPTLEYSNEQNGIVQAVPTASECHKGAAPSYRTQGEQLTVIGDQSKDDQYCAGNDCEMERVNVYLCSTCGKEFLRRDSLARHRKNHTNPRSNCCEFCQKLFGRKDTLLKHKRSKHAVQMT